MKRQELIAVGLFSVMVVVMLFSVGRNMGFNQGFEKGDTDAFAEGHIAGWQDAMLAVPWRNQALSSLAE